MDSLYPTFARANPVFYDHPARVLRAMSTQYAVATPESWTKHEDGAWVFYAPPRLVLPEQGWKVHLSTTATQAEELLQIAGRFCVRHKLPFKHLPDSSALAASNAKDANRASSGKFVTIYTSTERQLNEALHALGDETDHLKGPHVLSDLRWSKGPVFVRYGGFHRLFVDGVDGRVPAIRHPKGHLVPDLRLPVFRLPPWVRIPELLRPLLDALDAPAPEGFPVITGALHHSNAGGVYTGIDNGCDVVVKEARPHAGVTPDGRDAIERSFHEAAVLRQLADNSQTGSLLRQFEVHGHHYLLLRRETGKPLQQAIVARHPLIKADASSDEIDAYRAWATDVSQRLELAVLALHEAGFRHGDLHPGNILVNDDGDVVLIDFEMATPTHAPCGAVIGSPGYTAPPDVRGVDADLFSLRRVQLSIFAPLAPLLDLDPDKVAHLSLWARDRFHLDEDDLGKRPSDELNTGQADIDIDAVRKQLLADATPERSDRLWPGDPAQFSEPSYALAHGALGPILALHAQQGDVPDHLIEWAERACMADQPRAGLMDGLSGAGAAFALLGRSEMAEELLGRSLEARLRWDAPGLYSGPAGTALAYLRAHAHHPELVGTARAIFDELAERSNGWQNRSSEPLATGLSGVLRGPSGVALLAMRLYDLCGSDELLDLARAAVLSDLERCVVGEDGGLLVNEGWRLLPYFGAGSAGIATVMLELARRDPTFDSASVLPGLCRAVSPEFVLEPGLFEGRAGLILASDALHDQAPASAGRELQMGRHRSYLRMHAVSRPVGTGFPGKHLLRLSCDLATGSAGVLWALSRLRRQVPATLPLLDLPPVEAPQHGVLSKGGGEISGVHTFVAEPRSR